MKINIKGIIKKNKDFNVVRESVDYYNKLINILEVPYFQNLRSIGIDVDQYETIFSKLYNQPVSKYGDSIFNDNGKPIYYENSDGEWVEWKYDDKGNLIYNENSKGSWVKIEYDLNGNEVYYENSNGYIEDNRPNNINESVDYYDKIVNILEKPYFRNLETMGISEDQWEKVLSKLYNQPVSLYTEEVYDSNGKPLYYEDSDGEWEEWKYDDNGREIYNEDSNGFWTKRGYNENGNENYYETSDGYWDKREFDENGYIVYFESSDGTIIDKRNNNINESTEDYYSKLINVLQPPYFRNLESIGIDRNQWDSIFSKLYNQPVNIDEYNNIKNESGETFYQEDPDGFWVKYEYNSNGNETYHENSDGFWEKWEYDNNGNRIYFENSNGEIIDRRNNNLNESVDHYDKLINILEKPYFQNMETIGIDRNQYETIFSKLFNQPVSVSGTIVQTPKGRTLYYEDNGFWYIFEWKSNLWRIF
jgi:YD repeat-containing protein